MSVGEYQITVTNNREAKFSWQTADKLGDETGAQAKKQGGMAFRQFIFYNVIPKSEQQPSVPPFAPHHRSSSYQLERNRLLGLRLFSQQLQ